MGLDAFVNCNCYRNGKTTPFPLPDMVQYLIFEDGELRLDLPYTGYEDVHDIFNAWVADKACEHEYMKYIALSVAKWPLYLKFQQVIEQLGPARFPTIYHELIDENEDFDRTMPAAAGRMLDELMQFRELGELGRDTVLLSSATGDVLYEYLAAEAGLFLFAGEAGVDVGVDAGGFFIAVRKNVGLGLGLDDVFGGLLDDDDEEREEVFRALRFEQRVLERDPDGRAIAVEFYNGDNETRFVAGVGIGRLRPDEGGLPTWTYPRLLHIEQRRITPAVFTGMIDRLMDVCAASVATSNPILWW